MNTASLKSSSQKSIKNPNINKNKNNNFINNKSSNNLNNMDLSQSTSSYKKNKNLKNEKYQINCENNSKDLKSNTVKQINSTNNENEEEFTLIQNLWDDLGVTLEYQEQFLKYIISIQNEQEKNEIFFHEKNNLRKFREALTKLSAEISNRDNNIYKLKKYNACLMEKNDKIDANLFDKIQNIIKYLRINAVNIINQISKVREISSYYEMRGKWDPDKANKAYLYNNNYLLNMRKNIKFINNSILFNYLETDNGVKKTDVFFSNIKSVVNNENSKISIPISIELKNAINKCKYIILQDDFFSNIQKENDCIKQRNILSPKAKYKNNILPRASSEIYLANENDNKKYMTMFGHNKINLSRTLYYLKKTMGNNYEKMFMNQNKKNRQLNLKKDLDIMDKYFMEIII